MEVKVSEDNSDDLDIVTLLGEGSFGPLGKTEFPPSTHKLYQATHKPTGATVAVKVIPNETTDEIEKSMREVRILSRCDSPYIIRYLECFNKLKEMWIVMEHCDGGSMVDLIEANKESMLPEDFIRAVCASVVLALEYLHGVMNVCHRDVRCQHVLLTNEGYVKLAGFGRAAEMPSTPHVVAGSSYWMAPEVIRESHYDGRADVWSLGITVVEMAEGAPPHSELNPLRAIFVIPTKPSPTLADPDEWSPEMLDFVRCCCDKDPTQRHDSAMMAAHPFVKTEVTELRSMHQERASMANSSAGAASASYKIMAEAAANHTRGLPAIHRVQEELRAKSEG